MPRDSGIVRDADTTVLGTGYISATAKQDDCALLDKSITFLTLLVHATSFNFRYGGKSDFTSEDRERSNEEWPPDHRV